MKMIDIAKPSLGDAEWNALKEPLESGWLTQGPQVAAFEKTFCQRHHTQHGMATTSGTTALHLALKALGIKEGDEVIVPSFTWVASANAVEYCGAKPVFADISTETYNINIAHAHSLVSDKTRAIIAVHLFGLCADMDALRSGLPENIKIIEDAACAVGAKYNGTLTGGLGDMAAFSFHPRKIITTGEGGMLLTNSPEWAEHAMRLRNHGASLSDEQRHLGSKPYLLPEFNELGFNYRMTDLQAAVGLAQLRRLDTLLADRKKWASWYHQALSNIEWLKVPSVPDGYEHSWQSYVTYVQPEIAPVSRNELMQYLLDNGVSTRPGTHAVHQLAYYREKYDLCPDQCPNAFACEGNTMALPLHSEMSEADFRKIVDLIQEL